MSEKIGLASATRFSALPYPSIAEQAAMQQACWNGHITVIEYGAWLVVFVDRLTDELGRWSADVLTDAHGPTLH